MALFFFLMIQIFSREVLGVFDLVETSARMAPKPVETCWTGCECQFADPGRPFMQSKEALQEVQAANDGKLAPPLAMPLALVRMDSLSPPGVIFIAFDSWTTFSRAW